jgi:Tol biopolymer transport system component
VLHHKFQGKKPIILYASHADFQQTNALGGDTPSEGTQGVTEFFKHRMVLPFTGSYADFEHVLQHEMVHQFQFDVFSRGRPGGGLQTLASVRPPLWFIEGMAEYLSVGPIDPHTAMWLRDAALEGRLPTIEQLTFDPRIFPYRFGHAIFSYIGERWGDEAIGEILQSSVSGGGIEGALRRVTGMSVEQLSNEWRDAIQLTYLPQIADHGRARRFAQPVLTRRVTGGTINLAPALSPDGREIAFFSERGDFFVNLWLADAETGRVKGRLVRSALSTNYESLRFIHSSGAFSPDGRYFAITAKRKAKDDLVILDVRRDGAEVGRIDVPVDGLQTPNWSPDGERLVFTGFDGGMADLFIVNRDGSNLRRLTNDRYVEWQPSWSPDGKTIAFATDRGPDTDFEILRFGNFRLALYHLEGDTVQLLQHMEDGKNINPVWAPDGNSLAFVSDRTGISNIFLYDLGERLIYQLTDIYTGVSGISPLSPVLSWAREADRLAFAYYERGFHEVYAVNNPRALRRSPYKPAPPTVIANLVREEPRPPTDSAEMRASLPADSARSTASVYRSPQGSLRVSAAPPGAKSDTGAQAAPISIATLLDSATLALPDTTSFTFRPYKVRYSTDFVARPTIGYSRDNFGRGIFGGTAITLSDILGDHTLFFSGALNGRVGESQFLGAYINQRRRLGWAAGVQQQPNYFYSPTRTEPIDLPDGPPFFADSGTARTTRLRRFLVRQVFAEASYPFSRFSRAELGVGLINLNDATLEVTQWFEDGTNRFLGTRSVRTVPGPSVNYIQPSVAYVHDKTLFGFVGPFAGTRVRLEYSPTFGDWQFHAGTLDLRKYVFLRPFTIAMRGLFFGRYGGAADTFPAFLGSTELIRGYTAGSVIDNECSRVLNDPQSRTGCSELDELIGSKIAVANVELRFPLARNVNLLGLTLPPVEGAVFFDVGIAWNETSTLKLEREAGDDPVLVRIPLRSWGGSVRANILGILILRVDYTRPLDRPSYRRAYWTFSVGPTF